MQTPSRLGPPLVSAWAALHGLALFVAGCSPPPPPPERTDASATPPGPELTTTSRPSLPPIEGEWLVRLEGDVGIVTVPIGAREKRPVIVSLHGAGSLAEWGCGDWMGPTGGHAFVVCPRTATERPGVPSSWGSAEEAARRAEATLARARARYGAWMSDAPPVLVGFSQGAEMAVAVAVAAKLPIAALFVHEGGYRQQSVALGRLLASELRARATCSTWGCGASLPRRLGPHARTADYGPRGHSVGVAGLEISSEFLNLVGDLPEWSGLPTARARGPIDGHAAASCPDGTSGRASPRNTERSRAYRGSMADQRSSRSPALDLHAIDLDGELR